MRIEVTVYGRPGDKLDVKQMEDGRICIVADVPTPVASSRAVWAKTYKSGQFEPVDGKGFLVGPTRRLKLG